MNFYIKIKNGLVNRTMGSKCLVIDIGMNCNSCQHCCRTRTKQIIFDCLWTNTPMKIPLKSSSKSNLTKNGCFGAQSLPLNRLYFMDLSKICGFKWPMCVCLYGIQNKYYFNTFLKYMNRPNRMCFFMSTNMARGKEWSSFKVYFI